jgi:hypothetical protein
MNVNVRGRIVQRGIGEPAVAVNGTAPLYHACSVTLERNQQVIPGRRQAGFLGGGGKHVDMIAHNNSGISYQGRK